MSEDIMTDVYDGDIWKDFNGRKYQFFNEERNYAVMLNIDWFQPFKYTNTFIEPLVKELETAWIGFHMKSFKCSESPTKFRLALICVGCDIPASRKLCGFLGHAATKGCNKCMKSFEGGVGEKTMGALMFHLGS